MSALAGSQPRVRWSSSRAWRGALPYGILWGCAVVGMETVIQPVTAMTGEFAGFIASIGLQLVVEGIGIACLAVAAERITALRWLPLTTLAMALPMAAAVTVSQRTIYPMIGLAMFPRDADMLSAFSYNAWSTLFYGGLLFVARVFSLRTERIDRLLGRAELERRRSETALGEVRLQTLQWSVDPALLRGVMTDVQQRQLANPDGAERLLDELVGFLRLAMPSLQHRPSTLAAEVLLALAYARMRSEQAGGRARWQILVEDDPGDAAFPPLVLLPLLEAFAPQAAAPSAARLTVHRTTASVRVTLDGGVRGDLPVDTLQMLTDRLQIGLRALHDDRATVRHDVAACTLDIEIRFAPGAPSATAFPPPCQEPDHD